jgi:macrolide transport system ATP-binding/permease protein
MKSLSSATCSPLLQLRGVSRNYADSGAPLCVLSDIDLDIAAGEMVAIVGASGSGKSTLMHLLGCLDQPTAGSYRIDGRLVSDLDPDALAHLRREHFGFVFQHYHLLSDLTAEANVETPAIYADWSRKERRQRAQLLLSQLGLQERRHHRPGQLSGGQQQRVSIARALMNGGQIILADEPTGALDSRSGEELLQLLLGLNAQGHTIILVTHDMQVANHARRIVEIKDGRIVADRPNTPIEKVNKPSPPARQVALLLSLPTASAQWPWLVRIVEAGRLAVRTTAAYRMRSFLTMLGVIIGIASVVCVVALGEGTRRQLLRLVNELNPTSIIEVFSGSRTEAQDARMTKPLDLGDVEALRSQACVAGVTPVVQSVEKLQYRDVSAEVTVTGVDAQYFHVSGIRIDEGQVFDASSVSEQAQEVVINRNTRLHFFRKGPAVGEVIFVGPTPFRVAGVVAPSRLAPAKGFELWIPYTAAMSRITGRFDVQQITVRVADSATTKGAAADISALLSRRHGQKDFDILNSDALRALSIQTSTTMALLISSIAAISLIVGGIGVMNIMLVSVAERTHEIGIRMAVGARQADIRNQFLIEAVFVCLAGGVLGIVLALAIGQVFGRAVGRNGLPFQFENSLEMVFSTTSMLVAFGSATFIGIAFGFLPARRAARLKPIDALATK